MSNLITIENPVFKAYAFYAAIVSLKMMAMAFLTAKQRFRTGAMANPEDTRRKGLSVKVNDDVERVRRGHLNDLENITPFLVLGLLYVTTDPSSFIATWCFRLFAVSRIVHTFVYVICPMPQPSRAIAFFVGLIVNIFMAVNIVLYFMAA